MGTSTVGSAAKISMKQGEAGSEVGLLQAVLESRLQARAAQRRDLEKTLLSFLAR